MTSGMTLDSQHQIRTPAYCRVTDVVLLLRRYHQKYVRSLNWTQTIFVTVAMWLRCYGDFPPCVRAHVLLYYFALLYALAC